MQVKYSFITFTEPRAEITARITHEAVVKTPVQFGTHIEEKTIKVMDRTNGNIQSKTITTEKPIMGILNTPREVTTTHKTVVDLETGDIISGNDNKFLHGK